MTYTFTIINHSDNEAQEESVKLSSCIDYPVICQGTDVVFSVDSDQNASDILRTLSNTYGRERIRLREVDGWECCETELLGNTVIEERFRGLFAFRCSDAEIHGDRDQQKTKGSLVLASRSPRRREYLRLTGIPFDAVEADLDEKALSKHVESRLENEPFGVKAACSVMYLAEQKACFVLANNAGATVLGSDTIVTIDGEYLGKPTSKSDAYRMLRMLCGRDHHVYTGVSVVNADRRNTFFTSTRVRFLPWSDDVDQLIQAYIATGSPMDKAGAYGIQDMGALLVDQIRGDYYTVVGLPISRTAAVLQDFGFVRGV